MSTRIACFLVPLFPLAARLRSEPELLHEAVIITEGSGNAAYVIAATKRARKAGITVGLSLPQARAILPKVIARGRDSECERAAQEALFEAAESFSPRVEDAGEGLVYLDISGMERHWETVTMGGGRLARSHQASSPDDYELGTRVPSSDVQIGRTSPQPDPSPGASRHPLPKGEGKRAAPDNRQPTTDNLELLFARRAIDVVERAGLPVRVGVASSKLSARVAAELPKTPTIVAGEEARTFLAPLPITRLSPEMQIAATLEKWGITSVGDFARLPEGEVASRLGEMGRALHWAARGLDFRPLVPRQPPPSFVEGMDLEWPLVTLEPFLFIANAALDRLAKRLETHGLACRRIELSLRLEPDGFHDRGIDLPAPTRDVKTILTLIRLDLEATPPGAPVAGFTFVAHPDKPRRAQLSLFGPPALSPDKLATTVARLSSMLGADRVGTPLPTTGYAPERYGISDYQPPPPPEMKRPPRRGRGLLAVRVFRPAIELEVLTDDSDPLGRPTSIRTIRADPKTLDIHGEIRVASGPWTLEDGWWSDTPVEREYWDVELLRGGVFRVFRVVKSGEWYVDANYD